MDTKFYCNKCTKEVAFNTERCPWCGENFNAVKCPVCKLIGNPKQFLKGCPSCGFMNTRQEMGNYNTFQKEKERKRQENIRKRKQNLFQFHIPPVGYKIMLVLFIIILIVLLYLLFKV